MGEGECEEPGKSGVVRDSWTGNPSPGEAGTLKIATGVFPDRKVLRREIRKNYRRDNEASSFPESLTEKVHLGKSTPQTSGQSL